MIELSDELNLRAMLNSGMSTKNAADNAGISRRTAVLVKYSMDVVHGMPDSKLERTCSMLSRGFTVEAVSMAMRITPTEVNGVKRYFRLTCKYRNLRGMEPMCSGCKRDLLLDSDWMPEHFPPDTSEATRELVSIAEDVSGLDDLSVICSPLFFNIAARARAALAKLRSSNAEEEKIANGTDKVSEGKEQGLAREVAQARQRMGPRGD